MSLYAIPVGTYIMHDPDGDDTRHDAAVPADVYPAGHDTSANVIYSSTMATKPVGHDVAGTAPYDVPQTPTINAKIKYLIDDTPYLSVAKI